MCISICCQFCWKIFKTGGTLPRCIQLATSLRILTSTSPNFTLSSAPFALASISNFQRKISLKTEESRISNQWNWLQWVTCHIQRLENLSACTGQVIRDWKNGVIYFYPCLKMIVPKRHLYSESIQSYLIDFIRKTSLERPFVSVISPQSGIAWSQHCILLSCIRPFEEINLGRELSASFLSCL